MPGRRKPHHSDEDDDVDVDDMDVEAQRNMDVQGQLQRLIDPVYPEKFVAALHPAVQARVKALQGMQTSIAEVRNKYVEEHKAIEKKYEALFAPIFSKRTEIVTGEREATAEEVAKGQGEDYKAPEDANQEQVDEKGIPNFWLTAMKNHDTIGEIVEERDEECLKFLKNITAKNFEDPDTGFTLEFHFAENEFFSNTLLVKTYHLVEEDEMVLDKAEGCDIAWKPGKNLTVAKKKKKVKAKGGKPGRQVTTEEPCDSFFNFFKPPQMPDDMDDEDEDDVGETIEELVEEDYEVGCAIKDQLIPKAVLWFTGEAGEDFGDDEDDEDDEEKHKSEDEDSEEDMPKRKGGKGANKGGPKKGGGGGDASAQPECKQQ